jgi:hypothetical protein
MWVHVQSGLVLVQDGHPLQLPANEGLEQSSVVLVRAYSLHGVSVTSTGDRIKKSIPL